MSLRFRWITKVLPKRATSKPCATRRRIDHFQHFTSTSDHFLVPSKCRQLGNFGAGKFPVGTSRLCFSTQTKAADGKGKGANFGKFDDDGFFDKFLKDDEGGNDGYDSDDEKFLESTQKDFKKKNKPRFVADEFEKLTQPEITKIYEDRVKDIAHIIDPDLPGPDPESMDVLDLIDKAKDEFSSTSSQDVKLRDLAAGIDDDVSGFSPRYTAKPVRVML